MKIYVAGKLGDKEQIRRVQAQVRSYGHEITYDWTLHGEISAQEAAALDLQGVEQADAVIALFNDPTYAYRGTFTEIGAALALKKMIIAVCSDLEAECRTNCFFYAKPIQHVSTVQKALDLLEEFD